MESKSKLLGHPIHPILIAFPLGLLATASIFDLAYLVTQSATLATVAFWMIVAGIIGGVIAAAFGWWDWAHLPQRTRAARIGMWHGIGNMLVLGLYVVSGVLRWQADALLPSGIAIGAGFAGLVLLGVTGWLGGELVHRLRVSVDDGAHLDAPSSLSGQPATASATTKEVLRERAVGDDRTFK
jgi:uncharacterized membrane protein